MAPTDHRATFVLVENKLNIRSLLIGTNLDDGDISWRLYKGGHTPGPNWPYFIEFAGRYFECLAYQQPTKPRTVLSYPK